MAIKKKISGIRIKSTATVAENTFKKLCIHGFPGLGKTMLAATAAPFKPVIILTEKTGAESLTPSNIQKVFGRNRADILYDIPIIEAYTPDNLEKALDLVVGNADFDLIIVDSGSKMSRLILKAAKGEFKDGRKAYGSHNDTIMELIERLIDGNQHVVILAHSARQEDNDTGEALYYPSFEGQAFNVKFAHDMPHLLCLEMIEDDDGSKYRALRCHQGESNKRAKSRGHHLEELEEPHIGRLIQNLQGIPEAERIARPTPPPAPPKKKKIKKKTV